MGETRRLTPTLQQAVLASLATTGQACLQDGSQARLAASCLLRPEPGDLVLVAQGIDGLGWILAVLARAQPETPATLAHASGLTLVSDQGPVVIRGTGTVGLVTDGTVLLAGQTLHANAQQAVLGLDDVVVSGNKAELHIGLIRLVADRLDAFIGHALHRLKTALRLVEDADRTEAREIHLRASENLVQRGHVASLTAREDVRIDADRIHIG